MKFNLLIRTYLVENLYTSLFDLPNKIKSENVEIYIHNDNPDSIDRFKEIVNEFQNKYPNYIIHTIQEEENQHMFVSYLNSIKYFNSDNYWSMILDDDDTFCKIEDDFLHFLNQHKDNNECIKYKIFEVREDVKKSCFYLFHRIYPTVILKEVIKHEEIILELLTKYNKSTKFHTFEDKLMLCISETITKVNTILYEKEIVNYNIYPHSVNNYSSVYSTNLKTIIGNSKNMSIINNIIKELKLKFI